MKLIFPLILAAVAIPLAVQADDDIDDAARNAFNSFEEAWQGGDAKGIGALFDKDSKVALQLQESGSYSRDQAISIIKKYFEANSVVSLELSKDGYQGSSSPYATYGYEYTDADGRKQSARLYVALSKKNGRYVVTRIAVMGK